MSEIKYTVGQVRDIVEMEGFEYAITEYLSHDNIEDQKLANLWKEAKEAINKVNMYLGV